MFPWLIWSLIESMSKGMSYAPWIAESANNGGNFFSKMADWFGQFSKGETWDNMGNTIGDTLNNITGANAANQFSHDEAVLAREHATAERVAAQDYNSREAKLARDFQLYYDSTAMQRRVSDMQAAGLNPMGLYAQGAPALGTSSGASAASSSSSSSAAGSSSGSSASALSGIIRALATLVRSAK